MSDRLPWCEAHYSVETYRGRTYIRDMFIGMSVLDDVEAVTKRLVAAGHVAYSGKDSYALCDPEGFWDAVVTEDGEFVDFWALGEKNLKAAHEAMNVKVRCEWL